MQNRHSRGAWQEQLSNLVTDPKELLDLLGLDPGLLKSALNAAKLFPLKVTRGFVARMQCGDVNDPLLKQVLPLGAELESERGYVTDPLEEAKSNPIPGLLHKYHSRVLVTLTSACAIHCRFCFRRNFPYADNNPGKAGWENIINYIKKYDSINEVILSGGDPLTVSDRMLASFSEQLETIPQLKTLRIHSRVPVVLPERITDELIAWIAQLKLKCVLVIHANHPREVNEEVSVALQKLREAGVVLLNQSVLLKGINDDADILAELSTVLFEAGVLPYYLHMPDKVKGTSHFDVKDDIARELHKALATRVSGYLVPRLVKEEAGEFSKTWV